MENSFGNLFGFIATFINGTGLDLDLHSFGLVQKIPNIKVFKHLTLSDPGKLDLTVSQIAQQIIQESLHTFPMTSLLG